MIDNALVGDPNLQQVVSYTFEGGLRGQFDIAKGLLNWTVGGFHALNTNDILPISSPLIGHQFFQNAGNTLRQGIEANVTYKQDRWNVYANYTYVDATFQNALTVQSPFNPFADANGNIFVVPGDHIPGIPDFRFKLGGEYRITNPWLFGADLNVIGSQWLVGDQSNQNPKLPAYWVVNLHSSYKVTENVEVFGLVRNLFNQHYAVLGTFFDVTSYPYLNLTDPRTFVPGIPFAGYLGVRGTFPTTGPAFANASPPLVTKTSPIAWTEATSPAVSWTGIYLGLNGGFTFGGSNWTDSVTGGSTGNFGTSGFVFGGTVGANYQVGSLVFGVEADGDWADASGFGTFTATALCAGGCLTQNTWLSTARAVSATRSIDSLFTAPAAPRLAMCGRTSPTTLSAARPRPAGRSAPASRSRWREIGRPRRNTFSSTSPTGHAPLIALSQMQAEHPSFPTSPSNSTRASSAAASITDLLGSRSGLPFSEAQGVGRSRIQ